MLSLGTMMRTFALILVLASCGDDTTGGTGGHAGSGGSGGSGGHAGSAGSGGMAGSGGSGGMAGSGGSGGSGGHAGSGGSGGMAGSGGTGGTGGVVDAATDGNSQCLGIFESCMFGGIPCCSGLVCSGNVTGQCLPNGTDGGP